MVLRGLLLCAVAFQFSLTSGAPPAPEEDLRPHGFEVLPQPMIQFIPPQANSLPLLPYQPARQTGVLPYYQYYAPYPMQVPPMQVPPIPYLGPALPPATNGVPPGLLPIGSIPPLTGVLRKGKRSRNDGLNIKIPKSIFPKSDSSPTDGLNPQEDLGNKSSLDNSSEEPIITPTLNEQPITNKAFPTNENSEEDSNEMKPSENTENSGSESRMNTVDINPSDYDTKENSPSNDKNLNPNNQNRENDLKDDSNSNKGIVSPTAFPLNDDSSSSEEFDQNDSSSDSSSAEQDSDSSQDSEEDVGTLIQHIQGQERSGDDDNAMEQDASPTPTPIKPDANVTDEPTDNNTETTPTSLPVDVIPDDNPQSLTLMQWITAQMQRGLFGKKLLSLVPRLWAEVKQVVRHINFSVDAALKMLNTQPAEAGNEEKAIDEILNQFL